MIITDVKIDYVLSSMSMSNEKGKKSKIEIESDKLWEDIKSRIQDIGFVKKNNSVLTAGNVEEIAKASVFIFTEPRVLWKPVMDFMENALFTKSQRGTLLLISNIHPKDYFEETVKRMLLTALSNQMNFDFLNIDNFSFFENVEKKYSDKGKYI